jgi:hypothetical protein
MTRTAMVITACVCVAGIYDLIAVFTGGVEPSISRVMQQAGFDAPMVVFAVGFVAGHIFGYLPPKGTK